MAHLDIYHPLFYLIKDEHRLISEKLAALDEKNPDPEILQWHQDFTETAHHQKEEFILFNAIANHPKITEGGPMCTLYFDLHLSSDPLQATANMTGETVEIEEQQKKFIEANSPLKIPVNEHRATKKLLSFIIRNQKSLSSSKLEKLIIAYKDLQNQHIEKENNCLLPMCTRLLTKEQADQLVDQWLKSSI